MTPLHDNRAHTRWRAALGQPGHPWTRAGWTGALLILLLMHGALLMTSPPSTATPRPPDLAAAPITAPEPRKDPGERAWSEARQIPWDDWMQGLGSRLPGDVALVMLEPDPQAGRIDVEAHATSLPPLLRLGEALETWEHANRVDPIAHQPHTGTAADAAPPGTTLRMRWRISLRSHRKAL